MRHWSLEAVVSETGRLYWPQTHHLRGSGTWSNRLLSLYKTYIEPMMPLSHQRDSTAQLVGVHILMNRGTRCRLGWSITHQNLHPVLHSLEEGVLAVLHQCLNVWRCIVNAYVATLRDGTSDWDGAGGGAGAEIEDTEVRKQLQHLDME